MISGVHSLLHRKEPPQHSKDQPSGGAHSKDSDQPRLAKGVDHKHSTDHRLEQQAAKLEIGKSSPVTGFEAGSHAVRGTSGQAGKIASAPVFPPQPPSGRLPWEGSAVERQAPKHVPTTGFKQLHGPDLDKMHPPTFGLPIPKVLPHFGQPRRPLSQSQGPLPILSSDIYSPNHGKVDTTQDQGSSTAAGSNTPRAKVEVEKPHPLPVFLRFVTTEHAHHPFASGAFSNQASNQISEFNQHSSLAHSAGQYAGPLVSSDVYSPNNGKAKATQDHSLSIAASFNDTSHHHPGSGHSIHHQLNSAPVGHSYPDQPRTQARPSLSPTAQTVTARDTMRLAATTRPLSSPATIHAARIMSTLAQRAMRIMKSPEVCRRSRPKSHLLTNHLALTLNVLAQHTT